MVDLWCGPMSLLVQGAGFHSPCNTSESWAHVHLQTHASSGCSTLGGQRIGLWCGWNSKAGGRPNECYVMASFLLKCKYVGKDCHTSLRFPDVRRWQCSLGHTMQAPVLGWQGKAWGCNWESQGEGNTTTCMVRLSVLQSLQYLQELVGKYYQLSVLDHHAGKD